MNIDQNRIKNNKIINPDNKKLKMNKKKRKEKKFLPRRDGDSLGSDKFELVLQ